MVVNNMCCCDVSLIPIDKPILLALCVLNVCMHLCMLELFHTTSFTASHCIHGREKKSRSASWSHECVLVLSLRQGR